MILATLVEDYARRLGLKRLYVNAAAEAVGYYEKLGWRACVCKKAELVGIAAGSTQMSKDMPVAPSRGLNAWSLVEAPTQLVEVSP